MRKHFGITVACALALLPLAAHAQSAPTHLFGYGNAAAEAKLDEEFLAVPDAKLAGEELKTLTAEPHLASSPEDYKTAEYVAAKFRATGLATEIVPYRVLMNQPRKVSFEARSDDGKLLSTGPTPEHVSSDPYQDNPKVVMPFNGSSASGDVTGEVVYANYGTLADFDKLAADKVDLRGKVVLVRYGANFRGVKVYIAQQRGAVGVLIYSVFALPFALTGAMLAANGLPSAHILLWILVAMVTARSAAMAFNRWADAALDAANPRTRMRAIPAGLLTPGFVLGFTLLMAAIFEFACWQLNRLTLLLSPIVIVVLFGYSYMKRWSRLSHLILGLSLGIAPSAAWIAVRGSLDPRITLLTMIVLLWTAGFDILYACQDMDHDRQAGLHSIPAELGLEASFRIARFAHVAVVVLLALFAYLFRFGLAGDVGVILVSGLLFYEHRLVSPRDLSRLDAAFFTMNGIIASVFFLSVAFDLLLKVRH